MARYVLSLVVVLSCGLAIGDTITLKDGTVVEGKIVMQADDTVLVKTVDGKMRSISRKDIAGIAKAGARVQPKKKVCNCRWCYDSGRMKCPDCKGTGKGKGEKCPKCNGFGRVQCPQCSGRGKVTCSACKGKGQLLVFRGSNRAVSPCRACAQTGMVRCPTCKGAAKVTCDRCDSVGFLFADVKCQHCGGTGKVACKHCDAAKARAAPPGPGEAGEADGKKRIAALEAENKRLEEEVRKLKAELEKLKAR